MTLTPNLADVILAAMDARLDGVFTAMPGRIAAYNPTEQSVDVQPVVQHAYTDEQGNRVAETLPIVTRVPVMFPGSGSWSLTWPVTVGDTVLLVFCSCSIDKLLALGGTVDPEDDRRHHLGDAVAILGLRDFKHPLGITAVDSSAMVLGAAMLKLGGSDASDPVVRKSDLDSVVSSFNSHVHSGVTTGTGASGVPSSTITTPDCSSVVKAK